MTTAIYPGSFDPITNGHLDVLERASKIFKKVIIAVLVNPNKNSFLSTETKVALIKESVSHLNNVEVDSFMGLTVEYAKAKNANVLIRGLRAVSDFEYEMQMAQINQNLGPQLDTIFLITKVENNFVSSSIVKEISLLGGDIS
ncbi:MAG: pantetheine-phosphate adenylyltransferase, partial [Candidatus Melainabacteria bacterium GWA2_34_9]